MNYNNISVVIPNYNVDPKILLKSFESISNQTFKNFEVLLVDDSTNALSSGFCSSYCESDKRFKHIKPDRKLGLPESLNLGVQLSKYDIIARFDSDDICYTDRFEKQINFLRLNPDIDVLGGNIEVIDSNERHLFYRAYPSTHRRIKKYLNINCPIAHPTVMFKKKIFQLTGGYNSKYKSAEDLELWIRMLSIGAKFHNLDYTLIKYRQDTMVRQRDHYRFFLKARLANFHLKYLPYNLLGIFLLFGSNILPILFLEKYYKYKYKV